MQTQQDICEDHEQSLCLILIGHGEFGHLNMVVSFYIHDSKNLHGFFKFFYNLAHPSWNPISDIRSIFDFANLTQNSESATSINTLT